MGAANTAARAPRLLVIGSVNVDMVVRSSHLPAPGETVIGGQFNMAAGGKGANQAVAAARLGADVTLLAKVGRDAFGEQALENYRREGIRTDGIGRDADRATGVALILVNDRGENSISVASGANDALLPIDIEREAARFRQADMVLLQLEVPLETVICSTRLAREAGVKVLLDPAPAPAAPLDVSLLESISYLKPNESEAERLTGIRVNDAASGLEAAAALVRCGVSTAVITLGSRGACWATREESGLVPGYAVAAVDSTAAGDAFSAALACALAGGKPLEAAVRFANLVGALTTTRLGAQPSLPTRDEVERFALAAPAHELN